MLKRDQDTVIQMAYRAWAQLGQKEQADYKEAIAATVKAFETDSRVTDAIATLERVGITNAKEVVGSMTKGMLGVRWATTIGLMADLAKARAAVPAPAKRRGWNDSTASSELILALSTAKSKWADIQGPLYNFAADLSAAKDETAIEAAIRTFTKSIV